MNDDRELLEKAADAAGIPLGVSRDGFFIAGAEPLRPWNPLTDSGDALHLAVKLGLVVITSGVRVAQAIQYATGAYGECDKEDDPAAATRRAITRAAAAVWDARKEKTP